VEIGDSELASKYADSGKMRIIRTYEYGITVQIRNKRIESHSRDVFDDIVAVGPGGRAGRVTARYSQVAIRIGFLIEMEMVSQRGFGR
jgi:hypothetical protein